jgi:hypothetical protein
VSKLPVAMFSPASGAARWTRGLLMATMVLAVAGVASGVFQISFPPGSGEGSPEGQIDVGEAVQALIGLLQVLAFLGTGAAFLTWFYRASKNLPALGSVRLAYTPGWAVGGFFVPFLNLVRPLQVMREVWHCSDPSGLERDAALDAFSTRNRLGTPPLVGWWWACFLLSNIVGNAAARIQFSSKPSPDLIQVAGVLSVVSDLLDIPAALLAIRLVGRIASWQVERNSRIQQGRDIMALAAAVPPPPPPVA